MISQDFRIGKVRIIHSLLFLGFLFSSIIGRMTFSRADQGLPTETKIQTGPEIGQRIPNFQGIDQNGRQQSFGSIRGPRGALIVFYRSADW